MKSVFRSDCGLANYLTALVSHSTTTSLTFLMYGTHKHCYLEALCIHTLTHIWLYVSRHACRPDPHQQTCTSLKTSSSSALIFPLMICDWATGPGSLKDPPLSNRTLTFYWAALRLCVNTFFSPKNDIDKIIVLHHIGPILFLSVFACVYVQVWSCVK